MNEQDLDLDNLDNLLEDFDGVTVEGGVDSANHLNHQKTLRKPHHGIQQ